MFERCTSGYAIWNQMKRENEKVMVYKNVGRRVLLLHKNKFIEEIKLESDNVHWRKDYKLTMKGLEQLIPYLLTRPNEIETVVKYMDKFGLDKELFSHQLIDQTETMLKLTRTFREKAGLSKLAGMDLLDGTRVLYYPEGFSETLDEDIAEAEAAANVRTFRKQEPVKHSKKKKPS